MAKKAVTCSRAARTAASTGVDPVVDVGAAKEKVIIQ